MSEIIKIPIKKGINKEDNPSSIGANPTEITNFNVDRNGVLTKRKGMGTTEKEVEGEYRKMTSWLDPSDVTDSTLIWFGWDRVNGRLVKFENDFEYSTDLIPSMYQQVATPLVGSANAITFDVSNWDGQGLSRNTEQLTLYIKQVQNQTERNEEAITSGLNNTGDDLPVLDATGWGDPASGDDFTMVVTVADTTMQVKKNGVAVGSPIPIPFVSTQLTQLDNASITFDNTKSQDVGDTWSILYKKGDVFEVSEDDVTYSNPQVFGDNGDDTYVGNGEWFTFQAIPSIKMKITDINAPTVDDKWYLKVTAIPDNVEIVNWGKSVRFGFGPNITPAVFTWIDRKWFWMGTDFLHTFKDYYYDPKNYPIIPSFWSYDSFTAENYGELDEDTNYHYKMTALYDGDQETLFGEESLLTSTGSVGSGEKAISIKFDLNYNDFSPRLTGLKLYRAKSDSLVANNSLFQHIKTFDLTASQSDVFSVDSSNCRAGRRLFMEAFDGDKWDTNKVFGEETQGKYSTATTYLHYNDSAGSETATFEVHKIGTVNTDFVEFANDPGGNEWGGTGTMRLYPDNVAEIFNDSDINDATKWTFPDGNFSFRTPSTSTFAYTSSATETNSYFSTGKPMHHRAGYHSDGDGFEGNLGVDWGTTPKTLCISTDQNIDTPAPYFLIRGYHFFARFFEHGVNLYQKIRPSIQIIRDDVVVREEAGAWSATLDAGAGVGNQAVTQGASFQTWVGFQNFQILTSDKYRVKFDVIVPGDPETSYACIDGHCVFWGTMGGVDNVGIRQMYTHPNCLNQYYHQSVIAIPNSGLPDGKLEGSTADTTVNSIQQDLVIEEQIGDMCRMEGNQGWTADMGDANEMAVSADGYEDIGDGVVRINYVDDGILGGAYHPTFGSTSLASHYTYSTPLNGRNFVANVKVVSDAGEEEYYDDMVLFSEIAQPDVIPITNFIKLNDLQGGKIYGLGSILSDLIVFAEKGIYRLNIPESDPKSWSLIESEPNLGCVHPESVVKWRNGLFFAGTNNIYYITSNFQFIPIGNDIRKHYLDKMGDEKYLAEFKLDYTNDRLLCLFNSETTMFLLDLERFKREDIFWSTITRGTQQVRYLAEPNMNSLIRDHNNKISILSLSGGNTQIVDLIGTIGSGGTYYDQFKGVVDISNATNPPGIWVNMAFDDETDVSEWTDFGGYYSTMIANDIFHSVQSIFLGLDELVEGEVDSDGSDYKVDDDTGIITFWKANGTGTEELTINYKYTIPEDYDDGKSCTPTFNTGYIDVSNLAKGNNVFIRSINFEYYGSDPIYVSLYIGSFGTTTYNAPPLDFGSVTPADKNWFIYQVTPDENKSSYRVRVGQRAKGFQLQFSTDETQKQATLKNIEVEID